jgi:alanyl-tRNA synthetase
MRVIADHARATAFLIADGVFPDKDGRSYVLRRIMRRAIRYGHQRRHREAFFHEVCRQVVEEFGDAYPQLIERQDHHRRGVRIEEESFRRTLKRGLELLEVEAGRARPEGERAFPARSRSSSTTPSASRSISPT